MRRRLLQLFFGALLVGAIAMLGWYAWPLFLLWSAESNLNRLYREHRPFPYRWLGAPYSVMPNSPTQVPAGALGKEVRKIRRAEGSGGATSKSLQLLARINLLAGQYNDAVAKYKLARLLDPDNPGLQLELGVAYALRAETEGRAVDYEPALEDMLEAGRRLQDPEIAFDSALLFEDIPLPYQAKDQWKQAIQTEKAFQWQEEETQRLDQREGTLQARERYERELTASPESYLLHAGNEAAGGEFTLDHAVREWLPRIHSSNAAFAALNNLAGVLRARHHDAWLADILRIRQSPVAERALQELSESISANLKGEHLRASALAKSAEALFRKSGSPAGILRSRLENVYSLDRRSLPAACLAGLQGLRPKARQRSYTWIEAQAWLEEITCLTRTRSVDVIESRNRAYRWINTTGYDGLGLRALGFLTEGYVSADSRLTLWTRGCDGLHLFWSKPLPAMRGYSFYFNLARSASETGDREAAVVLVREGALLLREVGHSQLRALLLSNLGAWELGAGRERAAASTFSEMLSEFDALDSKETQGFRQEAEIAQAEAFTAAGHPSEGLVHLREVTHGLEWPYSELSANVRRPLLPAFGNAYLGLNDPQKASRYYLQAVTESREKLKSIHDRAQRDNAQREVESAWRGLTEVTLRGPQASRALATWEAFRSGRLKNPVPDMVSPPEEITFLVYAFLPGGLSGWLVDAHGVEQHWLDGPRVRTKAIQFSQVVATSDSPLDAVSKVGEELYELLLDPFAGKLPSKGTLIIDADGPLAGIPWAALESRQGHALVEDFALSQSVGWGEVASHLNNAALELNGALIFGPPVVENSLSARFPTLPDAFREAERLHRHLPHSLLFEKQDATVEAFVEHAPQAALFHFASHGISNGGFGALLLAPSRGDRSSTRFLSADEIAGLDLHRLELVVLAACSSGAGEEAGVVNLDGVTRAFLEAGAARVVAAKWDVSSPETAGLMLDFYDGLGRGEQPAEALRQAEVKVRQKNPHPYFWAGFQVFGAP